MTAEHHKTSLTQQTATTHDQHPEGNEGPKLQINDTNAHKGARQGNNSVKTTRDRRLAVNQLKSRGNMKMTHGPANLIHAHLVHHDCRMQH